MFYVMSFVCILYFIFVFFFKQKTAYEMRISDWSSDVCSSDLLLRDRTNPGARKMFSMAMWMAALVAPIQIFVGDMHGLNTLEHQPAKIMAMEGHYQSHPEGAPLILFGIPNSKEKRVDYALQIPKGSSLILKHDPDAPLAGLDSVPDDEEPPVGIIFWSFRIMVALGLAMLGLGLWSLVARVAGRLYDWPWLHRAAILLGPSG